MQFLWVTLLSVVGVLKAHFLSVSAFTVGEFLIGVDRKQPLRQYLLNFEYNVLFFLVSPFVTILPSAVAAAAARKLGSGLFNIDLPNWSHHLLGMQWPVRYLLLPAIPVLIFDFFYYWHHRLQHVVPVLWPIHRLHHTIENLNALAAYRVHWLELPMRVFTITIPMAFLFNITPLEDAWVAFLVVQLSLFIHANLRLPLGFLTPVLMGPQLHRLHHSVEPEHQNMNYAAFFPIWDIVFGTYIGPKRREWPVTGIYDGEPLGNVFREMAYPFTAWCRSITALFGTRPQNIPVIK